MWDAANSLLGASRGSPDDQLTPKVDVRDEYYKIKKIFSRKIVWGSCYLGLVRTGQSSLAKLTTIK